MSVPAVSVELVTGERRVFGGYESVRVTPDRTLLFTFPPGSAVRYTEIPFERILLWYKCDEPPPPPPQKTGPPSFPVYEPPGEPGVQDMTGAYPVQEPKEKKK